MSPQKTYFILPTIVYAPDDLIRLGQVIVDPKIPYRRLAEPLPLEGKLIPRNHNSGDIHLEGTPEDSFVFAYQLRKIHIDWRRKTRLGDHVGGADLHGEGLSIRIRESLCQQNREEVTDYKIDSATYDTNDFGAALPRREVKVAGIDECDGQQCLMIQATIG